MDGTAAFFTSLMTIAVSFVFIRFHRAKLRKYRTFVEKASQTVELRSRFWDIPELTSMVLDQLPLHDRASFAMTCRSLRNLATPLVWSTLDAYTSPNPVEGILPNRLRQTFLLGLDHLLLHVSLASRHQWSSRLLTGVLRTPPY